MSEIILLPFFKTKTSTKTTQQQKQNKTDIYLSFIKNLCPQVARNISQASSSDHDLTSLVIGFTVC